MAKIAVKQVWRHPETRLAFVYFADANTGAALSSLDGYTVSEAGSNINAPVGTQSTSAQSEPTQEESPVNTPLTTSEDRGGGEAFAPESREERAAKAQELMSKPGATVNGEGIVSVPTPSSGGFMSYDPNTGWTAYTNKDGITTTFDAQGNILGGPGLAPQLGTKSGSSALFEDLKSIPVLGGVLNAVLSPIGGAITNVIDKIMGQTGVRNPDGTVTYQLGEDQPDGVIQNTSTEAPVNAGYITPASEQEVQNISTPVSNAPSGSGNFSFGDENVSGWETDGQGVYNNLDGTISGGRTTPSGVTSSGFLGGVSQSFTSADNNSDKSFSGGRSGFSDQDVINALNSAAEEAGLQGWTNEDAIAFAANFAVENGAWGARGNQAGWDASRQAWSGEKSYGLGQWNQAAGRFQALQDFAKERGLQWDTLEAQSKFTIHELQTSYKNAWGQIRAAPNVQAKTALVMTHYEKPLDQSRSKIADRVAVANEMVSGRFVNASTQNPNNKTNYPFMGTFNATAPTQSLATQRGMTGINEGNIAKRSLEARTAVEDAKATSKSLYGDWENTGKGVYDSIGPVSSLNSGILSSPENFYGLNPKSSLDNQTLNNNFLDSSLKSPSGWESTGKGVFSNLGPVENPFNVGFMSDNFAGKAAPGIAQITGNPFGVGALGFTRDVAPITNVGPTIDNAIAANIAAATTNQPQAALSAWTPTYAQDIGVPNPNAISTLDLEPRAVQTAPIDSSKANDKSWQQSVVDMITPTIAPAIGWAIGKALEDYGPRERATQALSPSSGFMGSSPTSFRDAQNEQIREGLQLKEDLMGELSGKNAFQNASSSFGPAVNSALSAWDTYARENDLMTSRQAGVAAMSGIYDTVYDTLRTLNNNYQATRNFDKVKDMVETQPVSSRSFDPRSMYDQPMDSEGRFGGFGDRSVFSDIGDFAQSTFQTSQDRQAAEIAAQVAAQAAAAYGGGGSGVSVSTAGPSGGFDSGVYSGPSGWESSGGGGVWDSLGSGSAIDYGGGDSYGGGWASSAGSATGTAGSGVSSAGSSGTGTADSSGQSSSGTSSASSGVGTAGSASSNSGLSAAASATGTASSAGPNSSPGSTSGNYGGWGGWSGDGGWW